MIKILSNSYFLHTYIYIYIFKKNTLKKITTLKKKKEVNKNINIKTLIIYIF
jgi:hypothetical protein